jgi:hypothetical protein
MLEGSNDSSSNLDLRIYSPVLGSSFTRGRAFSGQVDVQQGVLFSTRFVLNCKLKLNLMYKVSCAFNVVMCFKVVWTRHKFLSVQSPRNLQLQLPQRLPLNTSWADYGHIHLI